MAKPGRGRPVTRSGSASSSSSRSRSSSGSDSRSRSRSRSKSFSSSSSQSRTSSSRSRSPPSKKRSPAGPARRGRSPPSSTKRASSPPRGTNFRVLRVQLGGKVSGILAHEVEKQPILPHLMKNTSEELFYFISSVVLKAWSPFYASQRCLLDGTEHLGCCLAPSNMDLPWMFELQLAYLLNFSSSDLFYRSLVDVIFPRPIANGELIPGVGKVKCDAWPHWLAGRSLTTFARSTGPCRTCSSTGNGTNGWNIYLQLLLTYISCLSQAANAAWNMGEWDQMADHVFRLDDGDEAKQRILGNTSATSDGSSNGTFFRAVLLVLRGK